MNVSCFKYLLKTVQNFLPNHFECILSLSLYPCQDTTAVEDCILYFSSDRECDQGL